MTGSAGVAPRRGIARRWAVLATLVLVLGISTAVTWALAAGDQREMVPEPPEVEQERAPDSAQGTAQDPAPDPALDPTPGQAGQPGDGGDECGGGPEAEQDGGEELVVSVVGEVTDPGLVTVRPGARVADAVEKAGGHEADADLTTLNLARKLSDGEQIAVGVPVSPQADTAGASGDVSGDTSSGGAEEIVDLNQATREQLENLSGVGEVTAGRILDWRESHGGFTAVEQLREIEGIGEKRLANLRDKVAVG